MSSEKLPSFERINNRLDRVHLEGHPQVFRSLFTKAKMLEAGNPEHSKIRPLLVVMPGTMRGVVGGGQVTALSELGLTNVFDNAIGISTGAPTISYFIAGQAGLGTTIYYEDLPENNFISFSRGLRGGNVADIDLLCDIFNGDVGDKALNKDALLSSRTKAHIVATEYETGLPTMFTIDGSIDPVEVIRASVAIPVFYKKPVFIKGKRYVDGVVSMRMPSREVIDYFDPTDVVVLANRSINSEESIIESIITSFLFRKMPDAVRSGLLNGKDRMLHHINQLRADVNRRYVIVWSDGVSTNEMQAEKLHQTAIDAYEYMLEILNTYGK